MSAPRSLQIIFGYRPCRVIERYQRRDGRVNLLVHDTRHPQAGRYRILWGQHLAADGSAAYENHKVRYSLSSAKRMWNMLGRRTMREWIFTVEIPERHVRSIGSHGEPESSIRKTVGRHNSSSGYSFGSNGGRDLAWLFKRERDAQRAESRVRRSFGRRVKLKVREVEI